MEIYIERLMKCGWSFRDAFTLVRDFYREGKEDEIPDFVRIAERYKGKHEEALFYAVG